MILNGPYRDVVIGLFLDGCGSDESQQMQAWLTWPASSNAIPDLCKLNMYNKFIFSNFHFRHNIAIFFVIAPPKTSHNRTTYLSNKRIHERFNDSLMYAWTEWFPFVPFWRNTVGRMNDSLTRLYEWISVVNELFSETLIKTGTYRHLV